MNNEINTLDGASVLFITEKNYEINGIVKDVDSDEEMKIVSLAICQYNDSPDEIYLFACDSQWNVVGDTVHNSIVEAKAFAENYYKIKPIKWIKKDNNQLE